MWRVAGCAVRGVCGCLWVRVCPVSAHPARRPPSLRSLGPPGRRAPRPPVRPPPRAAASTRRSARTDSAHHTTLAETACDLRRTASHTVSTPSISTSINLSISCFVDVYFVWHPVFYLSCTLPCVSEASAFFPSRSLTAEESLIRTGTDVRSNRSFTACLRVHSHRFPLTNPSEFLCTDPFVLTPCTLYTKCSQLWHRFAPPLFLFVTVFSFSGVV